MRPRTHSKNVFVKTTKPLPLAFSLARLTSALAVAAALAGAETAKAQTLNWDPLLTGTAASGGAGTWGSAANWYDGATDALWPNLATNIGVFGTTGGVVTIDTAGDTGVTANGLTFDVTGYRINGAIPAEALTLAGTTPTVTVNGVGVDTEISAVIAGAAGLVKAGTGRLVLTGANLFTGSVSLNGGTTTISADNNLGDLANGLTIDGGMLNVDTTFTSARALMLGAGGGTLDITPGVNLTLSSALTANGNALIKTGTGTVTLGAASTRTGTTAVNGGTLAVTNVSAAGTGAVTVGGASSVYEINTGAATSAQIVNVDGGGTFQWTQNAQLTLGSALNVTGTGGTVFVGGSGSTGKVLANAGLITSTAGSTTTKTGSGVLQLSGANTGFLGDLSIQAGTVEFQNADSLGTAIKTITVGGTGDLATSGVANRNSIVLNAGGTLSANNSAANYTGSVTASGNANIALRQFQAVGTANSFLISGPINGAGNLAVAAPAAATLTLTGNNTGYSGVISAGANATILATAKQAIGTGGYGLAGGTVRIQAQNDSFTLGSNGLNATYYNFGTNVTAANQPVTSTQFAGDLLYLTPRAFSRVDAQVNVPQAGGAGTLPIIPVPGFGIGAGTAGGVNDGILWKGLLNITNAGTYQFKGNNDDNLTVFIDGVQIGTIGVSSPLINIGTAVSLTAGSHSIVVKQSQGGGGGYARVLYNGGAGSDAPVDEILGADPGSLTTGSLGAIDIGPVSMTASSTLDLLNDATTSSLNLGNGTLTITSQTLNTLVAAGGTITAATPTIAVQNNSLTVTGGIGQSSAGLGLSLSGPGLTEFQGANSYTGTTTVTGGQLRLNQSGAGDSIAGNLTVNAGNANGDIANVRLIQDDQIADTALLTMTSGILDLGASSDTVGSIAMNGGRIIGGGTLTVTGLGTSTLTSGTISANLAGGGGLTKTGAGTFALSGANTYTGLTTVSLGTLKLQGGSLGAGGAGNETTVAGGAQLFITNTNSGTETVSVNDNNGIRVAGGTATLDTLNFTASAAAPVARVDAGGELILNTALTSTALIAKEGSGALTFNYNVGATLPANVLHNAGALGFNGTQSFGAAAIPAGRAFKFNSDPLASGGAVNVTAPAGTTVIAGYAAANELLLAINAASAGTLALGVDSGAALDFSADSTLSLGAVGIRTYGGTITPGASGYRLSGGGGELTVTTALSGANNLTLDEGGTVILRGPQSFTGTTTIDGAGRFRMINNHELGAAANGVTLTNGGTLELIGTVHDSTKVGALFHQIGNPVNGGQRTITVGTGGGTINANSLNNRGNAFSIAGTNALTGSGNLLKTGYGEIFLLGSSNYSGNLILDAQGGAFQIRSAGKLANVNSVTIGQSAELIINNFNAIGSRQFPEASDLNRLNDAAQITLRGGSLSTFGNDTVGTNEIEAVGTVVIDVGRNAINVNKGGGAGTAGAQLTIANLSRAVGGGVIRFAGTTGTYGTAGGDHSRILFTLLNGVAPTAGVVLPWATGFDDNYAVHGGGAFVGVNVLTGTAQGTGVGFAPVATTLYNFNTAAAATTLTFAAGNQQLAGFRFGNAAFAASLLFAAGGDTLFVGNGVIISDNQNQLRTIGVAATRGIITSGLSGAAAGAKELFFHNNQGTLAVESVIVDNNGAVTVHKGIGGGTLELRAASTYSGGTIVHSGRVNANVAGSLGSGPVTVKGGAIELRQPGTTTSTSGFSIQDRSEVFLQNGAGVYTQPGDRFTLVGEGNMLTGSNGAVGQGLNSLTRVSTITGGGQVVLPAGSIVRSVSVPNGVVDINLPVNLGTNSDLYFNVGGGGGALQNITVGAGTAWKGLSSAVGGGWTQGAINANGDFYLQGLNRVGGNVTFSLGATGNAGGWTINNLAGKPLNAFIEGQVVMQEDAPISLPSDLTFVVTPGGFLQPNVSNQFGADNIGLSRARILVQAGGTVDPGSFVGVGAAASQPFGMPYPIPSPVNAFAIFEAGSRFQINDASGIGSTTGGATWTMKADSILYLNTAAAFLGSNAGLINAGQFVYEPGAIIRQESNRVYKHDQFVNNEPNGQRTVLEIFNGDRQVTDAVNPFVAPAVGTSTVVAMNLSFSNGGMITNDDSDRTLQERRGQLVLNDGTVLAGTNQTYFNIQENMQIAAGATVTIGSTRYVDGMPKLGAVQLTGSASNTMGGGAKFLVLSGAQLSLNAAHTFPDTGEINLPTAVDFSLTAGAVAPQIGNGSSLLLNTGNYLEIIGTLTGNGAVYSNNNVDNTGLGIGWGATGDLQFDGQFRTTAFTNRSPNLAKVGTTTLTLTGTSDSAGSLTVYQGELALAGANGKWSGGEMRLSRGGTLTFDNSVTAITDRQGVGTGNRWLTAMGGGNFQLLGNATQVADVAHFGLANSAGSGGSGIPGGNSGGLGTITILRDPTTSSLTTSVTFGQVERFDNSGTRTSAWLFRGPSASGLPGTYDVSGAYAPNAGNPVDGLAFITLPRFISAGTYDANGGASGFIFGAPGSSVVPVRGDLLASANVNAGAAGNWAGVDFATIDIASGSARTGVRKLQASEYASTAILNANRSENVRLSAPLNLTNGSTQFNLLKLENGSGVIVGGTLPNLTQPGQVLLNAGGLLIPEGATGSIASAGSSVFRSAGGVAAYVHGIGDLNVTGNFFSDVGLVKTGPGTATFGPGSLDGLRSRLSIHDGAMSINDTLGNNRNTAAGGAVGFGGIAVALNGGTLNLNGNSQFFSTFESGNILPGAATEGGTITSAAPATISIHGGGGFSGHIAGAISIDKGGNNTLLLTNTHSTSGDILIRQGTIVLRDSGTLPSVTTIGLSYGRLDIDNGYLTGQSNRLNAGVTLNMRGGDFVNRGHAATLTQESVGTVNLLQGHNLFQTLAGGAGATETYIGDIVRSPGTSVGFQQNFGFIGTAGSNTTAIRYLPTLISGAAPTLVNNILPAWMIVNGDNFATFQAGRGIGAMGNTDDGFATYDSGDLSAATALQNVNDGTARTIAASKTVNSFRFNAGVTMTLNAGVNLTLGSGGLLAVGDNGKTITGGALTSGTGELNVFINQNTTTIASPIIGAIALTKAGSGTLTLTGANSYTGITYANAGTGGGSAPSGALTLSAVGANGTTVVSVPGDLVINGTTVNVGVASSIANTSNVTFNGGSILNMRDAASTIETLSSLTFLNPGGDNTNRPIITRANAQATSALNLTAATAISSTNFNATSTPTMSTNLGAVNFTRGAGLAQILQLDSPVSANGLAAVSLLFNTNIGTVPTGVAEGGLIKAGNGLLVLAGAGTTQFGNPGVTTEVFNLQGGFVRVDNAAALGPVTAVTTVQSGATLLLNTGTGITGSVRLKDGSRMGATITGSLLGAVGSTGFLDIPTGATVQIDAFDSLIPNTNAGNVTVNHLLTGSGTINQVGIEYAAGYNAGGLLQLRNTGNTFSGVINAGTNSVLEANPNDADLSGSTFGTATINLNGGTLRVRDQADNLTGAQTITYGNNVNLNASSFLDLDRQGTVAANKTIEFGTLTVAAGTHVLNTFYGRDNGAVSLLGNSYRAAFTQVDGPGTLTKSGTRFVDLNGYAGTFLGNIVVAGPQGLSLSTSGNLTLNAATNSLSNLTVRGYHDFAPGKAVTLSSTLEVSDNAGSVDNGIGGVSTGSITGVVTLNSTSTISAAVVRNNGVIGASNSPSTLSATSFQGSGLYQAFGQNLILDGALANDGASATTFKVAGTGSGAAVVLAATASTNTGGTQVQTGTLTIAPTGGVANNPLGTGPIRVFGAPVSVLGPNSQPVAAQNARLNFAGTTVSQAGNITNTGTVRTSSGTTNLPGVISGTAAIGSNLTDFLAGSVPGLLEGRATSTAGLPDTDFAGRDFSAARPGNPGNFGVRLEPRMGQTNVVTQNALTGWTDNTAWIYTGYFYDADGVFTFMENVDDSVLVSIDGETRLLSNSGTNPWQTVTSTATAVGQRGTVMDTAFVNTGNPQGLTAVAANPDLPASWHSIEIRFDNGTGGGGPVPANGFANNYGFGLNPDGTMTLDGTQALRPIDSGDGTLFRTAAAGKGTIEVEGGSTLNVGSFTQMALVKVGTEGISSFLNINGSSTTDALIIGGAPPFTPGFTPSGQGAGASSAVVPEPASIGLLLTGALGLLGRRRQTQSKK